MNAKEEEEQESSRLEKERTRKQRRESFCSGSSKQTEARLDRFVADGVEQMNCRNWNSKNRKRQALDRRNSEGDSCSSDCFQYCWCSNSTDWTTSFGIVSCNSSLSFRTYRSECSRRSRLVVEKVSNRKRAMATRKVEPWLCWKVELDSSHDAEDDGDGDRSGRRVENLSRLSPWLKKPRENYSSQCHNRCRTAFDFCHLSYLSSD